MQTQDYANHRRYVPMFHGGLFLLICLTSVGSLVNLFKSFGDHERLYSASLIVALVVIVDLLYLYTRRFPLRVQDRIIRAEENMRHIAMTGKLLDPRLTMDQIIGLRFASDEEFLPLAKRAADEGLSREDIKKAIRNWRPDHHRA